MSNRHYQINQFLNDDEIILEEEQTVTKSGNRIKTSSHTSTEDLYKSPIGGIGSPNMNLSNNNNYHYVIPQYHSPPFDIFKHHIQSPPNQQQQQLKLDIEGDPNKRSISPIYINPSPNQRRTHKRSNSHNPPSKSLLYSHHSPPTNNQYLSPPYIKSPTLNSPNTNSTTTTTTTTTTSSSNNNNNNGGGGNNKNITWSPAATKRKSSSFKSSLDPSIFLPPSSISHNSSPIDGRSPPLSPRTISISGGNGNSNQGITSPQSATSTPNHRRGISWEPSIQGKSPTFETLNQIIREKKDAILQRERELILKQKILESQLSSSPPSSNTPPINIPITINNTNNNNNNNGINPSSPPSSNSFLGVIQPQRVLKHNRSKSDTTTILKLHNAINKSTGTKPPVQNQSQQQQIHHPPSPINNFIFINEQIPTPQQYSNTSTTTTTTTTILTPSKKPLGSVSSPTATSSADGNKSPNYQKIYSNVNVTSPRMVLEQQLKHQEKLKRRKSIDPNILIHPQLQQQHQQHQQPHLQYNSHNYNSPQLQHQQYFYQSSSNYHAPSLTTATAKLKNSTYNIQQLLTSLKSLDLDEFEEEIDKEIQQVILQTKNIQGKVDLLERVRCTAPDPLLMLFGENYNQPLKNNNNNNNNNNSNNNNSNSNTIISATSTSGKSKYMKSKFVSSPHLYQNNVYYPSSEHIQLDEYPTDQVTRCPDKSKSKNLNSLPRSSAFSPPPRLN